MLSEPSNRLELVKLSNMLATILFIESNGFSWLFFWFELALEIIAEFALKTLDGSIFLRFWENVPPDVALPVDGLNAASTRFTIPVSDWLSMGITQSACSVSCCIASIQLYGDVITSSSSGDG